MPPWTGKLIGLPADEFVATAEEVVGRKVLAMLDDHNAVPNVSVRVILLKPNQGFVSLEGSNEPAVKTRRAVPQPGFRFSTGWLGSAGSPGSPGDVPG
jgi:hypothetical protein